jgi:murein DD-endopeptidase MepM/ murein hydrolase activator NlpD
MTPEVSMNINSLIPAWLSRTRLCVVFVVLVLQGSESACPSPPKPKPSDGTSFVVRLEAPHGFLKVNAGGPHASPSDADASFVLFDLDRGELKSGDEVLLLNTGQDSYLRGGAVGASVSAISSGPSAPGSSTIGFCNTIVVIEAQGGGVAVLANGNRVHLRVFASPCGGPSVRGKGGFISAAATGVPNIVGGPPGADETFVLHIDRAEPYTITRGLSAPFARPFRFNSNNLVDLDWHNGVQRVSLNQPPDRTYENHTGIDFDWAWPGFRAMQEGGAAVLAVAAGKVVYAREDRGDRCHTTSWLTSKAPTTCPPDSPHDTDKDENEVIIRHDDGTAAVYTHLMKDSVTVNEGDRVRCGQLIGRVGSAGSSSHPHLHFELRRPHDPDYWTKHPDSVRYPHFWDHSMYIDPYAVGAWKSYEATPPGTPLERQFIPTVTCESGTTRRLDREDENLFLRSQLARGYLFDRCGDDQSKCGENYYCGSNGYCERRVQAGEACASGYQCPPLHGCQNGVCRLGPNCTDKCLLPCFTDAENRCMREESEVERRDCRRAPNGACLGPCFEDAQGGCKFERPTGGKVRKECARVCVP